MEYKPKDMLTNLVFLIHSVKLFNGLRTVTLSSKVSFKESAL